MTDKTELLTAYRFFASPPGTLIIQDLHAYGISIRDPAERGGYFLAVARLVRWSDHTLLETVRQADAKRKGVKHA